MKMKQMALPDLLNLLWSAQEIKRGSLYFYTKIEEEIMLRIRQVKDDDLSLLLECFTETAKKDEDEDKH